MTTLIEALVALAIGFILFSGSAVFIADKWGSYYRWPTKAIVLNVIGLACLLATIVLGVVTLCYGSSKASCYGYGRATGRPVKFVVTSGYGSWDCFTKAHDGKWIPKDDIGDYNK